MRLLLEGISKARFRERSKVWGKTWLENRENIIIKIIDLGAEPKHETISPYYKPSVAVFAQTC